MLYYCTMSTVFLANGIDVGAFMMISVLHKRKTTFGIVWTAT